MEQEVKCEIQGPVGCLELNRPKALNALTLDMIRQFRQCLQEWEERGDIQALLVYSTHPKAYCAGGDIRFLYGNGRDAHPEQLAFFREEYRLNYHMARYHKPVIALINGIAMGGGIGISLHASHPVALDNALFAMPETAIGFFPDIGASYLLSRCPGAFGMYLALSGRRFTAFEAQYLGLVKGVIAQEALPDFRRSLLQLSAKTDAPLAIEEHCRRWAAVPTAPLDIQQHADQINAVFCADSLAEIHERLAQVDTAWSRQVAEDLKRSSPLSLLVTFEQMRRAQHLSLADCLHMDYGLAANFMQHPDFYEGVRAMVIDKDKHPQWANTRIADIAPEEVQRFFQPAESSLSWEYA
ncbi:MAG: enoyl-CoA hydratase/isomerase family protein [Legionellaceae bacterium]|nr:enoyl-CoA hydratase/isomerase family protein [Legionellaceae bacterium]